ncbi:MAG: glutathione S-transferase family protein [Stellaceae bacterium]
MSVALYHFGNSVCSQKARLALHEKGVTGWESHEVDLFRGDQFNLEYLRLNPKAVVPTLVDDGKVIVESTLIAEYIDDRFDGPSMKPADPFGRAGMRLYSKACDEGVHQAIGVISFAAMFMDRLRRMSAEELAAHLAKVIDLERRDRYTAIHAHGAKAPHIYRGVAAIEKLLQKTEHILADGRPWLLGDQLTLAEVNLAPYLSRLEYVNVIDIWLAERPLSTAWFARIKARPSFEKEVVAWINTAEWQEMREGGDRIKDTLRDNLANFRATDFGARHHL